MEPGDEDFEIVLDCWVCHLEYEVDDPWIEDEGVGDFGTFLAPAVCPRCGVLTRIKDELQRPIFPVGLVYAIYGIGLIGLERHAMNRLADFVRDAADVERCVAALADLDLDELASQQGREHPREVARMLSEGESGVLAERVRELGELALAELESERALHLELARRRSEAARR